MLQHFSFIFQGGEPIMQMAEYIDEMRFQLSGYVVNLEIDKDLEMCVRRAFREIKRFVTTPCYLTIPCNSRTDLSDKKVYSVINVMRSSPYNGSVAQDLDVFTMSNSYINMANPSNYVKRMMLIQQRNTISTDLDFMWDAHNKYLYLSMNPPYPPTVTIQYIPDYQSVEEVTDPYWENYILRLSVAYAKEVLGRVRGKYELQGAQYQLDSATLLAEAKEEITSIRDFLQNNVDLAFPID